MGEELVAAAELNTAMQGFFQRWHAVSERRNRKTMMDQRELTWFADMNTTLHDKLDDEALASRLRHNVGMMRSLAATIVERAAEDHPAVREGYGELASGGTERMKLFA
jgi:hypothetical protein